MNTNDTLHGGLLIASVLGLLAIATVGATPVQAAEQNAAIPEARVSFSRQQLADPQAANRLYKDLRHAAAKVCGASDTHVGDLQSYALYQACYRETLHDAIAQINAPELLAMYGSVRKEGRG